MKSTNVTSDYIDKWETSERDGNITATSVAVRVSARSPGKVDVGPSCLVSLSVTLIWHLSPRQCSSRCQCWWEQYHDTADSVQIVRPSATVAIICLFVRWWAGHRITRLFLLCKVLC